MAPFQCDAYAKIQGSFILLKKLNEDGIKNVMFCLYEQFLYQPFQTYCLFVAPLLYKLSKGRHVVAHQKGLCCCTSIPLSRDLQSTNIPRTGQNKTTLTLGMPLEWVLGCFPTAGGIIKETISLVNVLNPLLSRHPCCTYDLCVDGCREKREHSPISLSKPLVTMFRVCLCQAVGLRR